MNRALIVARIVPGAEPHVARIFAESDRTDLPAVVGVTSRELYRLGDVYVHLVETAEPAGAAIERGRGEDEFRAISRRLEPFITPYLATWKGPRDAMAHRFYRWTPQDGAQITADTD